MAHHDEPPADELVVAMLGDNPLRPSELVEKLEADDYDRHAIQRAVRRCLDRGKIQLDADLRLEVARELQAA